MQMVYQIILSYSNIFLLLRENTKGLSIKKTMQIVYQILLSYSNIFLLLRETTKGLSIKNPIYLRRNLDFN